MKKRFADFEKTSEIKYARFFREMGAEHWTLRYENTRQTVCATWKLKKNDTPWRDFAPPYFENASVDDGAWRERSKRSKNAIKTLKKRWKNDRVT